MPRIAPIEYRTDNQIRATGNVRATDRLLTFADVNRDQLAAASLLGYRNPYATACAKMLMGRCFAGGMHVTKGGVDVTEEYAGASCDFWPPLLQDAVLQLFMFGFCLIRRESEELGDAAVVSPLDVRIQIRYIRGATTYRIFDRYGSIHHTNVSWGDEPITDIVVFDTHPPMSDGSLRSHFASMFETYSQLQLINDSAVIIWGRGASPTVLTEQDVPKADDSEARRDISYAGDRSLATLRQRRLAVDPAEHIRAQLELQRATNTAPPRNNAIVDSLTDAHGGATIVQLPIGQTVSHVLPNAQPPDVRNFMDYVGEQMALIFGIPPMWKLPARQSSSNDAVDELLNAAFESTTRLLKVVAEVLMADRNRVGGFLGLLESAGGDPSMITDDMIKTQIFDVSFPGLVSIENIEKLRAMGLLDHAKLRAMVAASMRISEDRLSDVAFDMDMDMPVAKRIKREDTAAKDAAAAKATTKPFGK